MSVAPRSFTPRRPSTLLAVAFAASLSACGGGGDADVSDPAPAAFVPALQPLPAGATETDKHMQIARQLWAKETGLQDPVFCASPGTSDAALSDFSTVPIVEIFDGFYYTGFPSVGQFVQKTPDGGFVLYDTLYSPRTRNGVAANDVLDITVPQLRRAGMAPINLRAILLTHGHTDHDGGVASLFSVAGRSVPVYIGSADATATKPYLAAAAPFDSANLKPTLVNVAGLPITFLSAPGHTAGTLNYIVPVTFKGKAHKLAYWGGSGFPTSASAARGYLDAVERMYDLVKSSGADASINSHTFFDHSDERIEEIRKAGGLAALTSNPMVQGNDKILRSYISLRACASALLFNRDATAVTPVWRPTAVEFYSARLSAAAGNATVRARVSNDFQVINGGTVKFTTESGASCTATTDASGLASCSIPGVNTPTRVTAEFQRREAADGIDMDSRATREAAL